MRTELSLEEIEEIKNNEWLTFSTARNNIPRSIVVMPSRVESNQIILSNIQMVKTIEYIKDNPNAFINVYVKNHNDRQYKIECECEVFENGELYEEIKEYEENNNLPETLKVHSIIIAKFKSIELTKE